MKRTSPALNPKPTKPTQESTRGEPAKKKRNKTVRDDPLDIRTPKNAKITVIKCTLKAILKGSKRSQALGKALKDVTPILSRWTHEACAFANAVVHFCLENPTFPLPEVNHLFFNNCYSAVRGRPTKKFPVMNHLIQSGLWKVTDFVQSTDFSYLPYIQQSMGRVLATNTATHLWYKYKARQRKVLRIQIEDANRAEEAFEIINGYKPPDPHHPNFALIEEHKRFLPSICFDYKVTETWLKENPLVVLKYYKYFLLVLSAEHARRSLMTSEEIAESKSHRRWRSCKLFTLLPMRKYQLCHTSLSSRDLWAVLKWSKLTNLEWPEFNRQRFALWHDYFKIPPRNNYRFNCSFATDGVQVSLQYWQPKKVVPVAVKQEEKQEAPLLNLLTANRGLYKCCDVRTLTMGESLDLERRGIHGIDPGRNTLIKASMWYPNRVDPLLSDEGKDMEVCPEEVQIHHEPTMRVVSQQEAKFQHGVMTRRQDRIWRGVEAVHEEKKVQYALEKAQRFAKRDASLQYDLSKAQWYEETGLNVNRKRVGRYHYQLPRATRDRLRLSAESSYKVSTFAEFIGAWNHRNGILNNALFQVYQDPLFCKNKFTRYRKKQSFLKRYCRHFFQGREACIVAFGNGKFPTSSRGERPGPGRSLAVALSREGVVCLTDECRTSVTCHLCHHEVKPVPVFRTSRKLQKTWDATAGRVVKTKSTRAAWEPIHAIRRCVNRACYVYHDRDLNAAENIKERLYMQLTGQGVAECFKRRRRTSALSAPASIQMKDTSFSNLLSPDTSPVLPHIHEKIRASGL